MFADELPGKTGFSKDCLVAYDSEGRAAFDSDQLRHLLVRTVVDYYAVEEHSGIHNMRPVEAWRKAQRFGVLPAPTPRVRRNATGLRLRRRLTTQGVRILGTLFNSPELFPNKFQNGNRDVDVLVDPNDLREVSAVIDGKLFYLENQHPQLAHHSLRTLMAALKEMTATRESDQIFYEHVIAKYADWFAQKIEVGIADRGLPSTELSERELDMFERMYVFNIQIAKTPEQAVSADIDEFLSGSGGRGIHTADQIVKEKADYGGANKALCLSNKEPVVPDEIDNEDAQTDVDTSSPVLPDSSNIIEPDGQSDSKPLAPKQSGKLPAKGQFVGAPKGKGTFS